MDYNFLHTLAFTLCFLAGVGCGYDYQGTKKDAEFAQYKFQVAQAKADDAVAHKRALAEATNTYTVELQRLTLLASSRGTDIERLRQSNARLQARLKARPESPDAGALARCSKLLTEGAELLGEGEQLLLRHGAEHDTLVRIDSHGRQQKEPKKTKD